MTAMASATSHTVVHGTVRKGYVCLTEGGRQLSVFRDFPKGNQVEGVSA